MRRQRNSGVGFVPSSLLLVVLWLGGSAVHSSGQSPEVDAFNPSGSPVPVTSLALQPDGRVLVGGWRDGDVGQGSLVRLNADGTVENGFNATGGGNGTPFTVYSLGVQQDGQIAIACSFP